MVATLRRRTRLPGCFPRHSSLVERYGQPTTKSGLGFAPACSSSQERRNSDAAANQSMLGQQTEMYRVNSQRNRSEPRENGKGKGRRVDTAECASGTGGREFRDCVQRDETRHPPAPPGGCARALVRGGRCTQLLTCASIGFIARSGRATPCFTIAWLKQRPGCRRQSPARAFSISA